MEDLTPSRQLILLSVCLQVMLCFTLSNAEERNGPQFISVPPSRVDFANTKGGTLVCGAHGNPTPTIQWLDSYGRQVQTLPGLRIVDSNGTLTFPPFVSDNYHKNIHAAVYRCVARNRVGAILSPSIRANAVLIQNYRVQLHDNHVMRGNSAVFKCQVPRFVKDYVTVTSWGRPTDALTTGGRISILPSGELHIRNIREQDGVYQYRCFTRNRLTGVTKSSQAANLFVAEPVNTAPEIIDSNTDYVIPVGDTLELPCVASGSPRPLYTWTKDGLEIIPGDRFRLRGGNLVISSIQLEDGGSYVCEAKNELRIATASRYITVTQPLSVFFYPQKRTVDVGAFASFNCSIEGYPIDSVRWYKDAIPLDQDERVTVYENGTMVIAGMRREDRGMYQCVASNSWDTQEATMQLSLGGGGSPPDEPPALAKAIEEVIGANSPVFGGIEGGIDSCASPTAETTQATSLLDAIMGESSYQSQEPLATSATVNFAAPSTYMTASTSRPISSPMQPFIPELEPAPSPSGSSENTSYSSMSSSSLHRQLLLMDIERVKEEREKIKLEKEVLVLNKLVLEKKLASFSSEF